MAVGWVVDPLVAAQTIEYGSDSPQAKVASLGPLAARLKRQKTSIPITHDNEQAYKWWLDICGLIARQLQIQPAPRPVDVERGLFYLVERGKGELAERLLSSEPWLRAARAPVPSDSQTPRDDDASRYRPCGGRIPCVTMDLVRARCRRNM